MENPLTFNIGVVICLNIYLTTIKRVALGGSKIIIPDGTCALVLKLMEGQELGKNAI